ncbi:hypothetical protein [Rhodococcus sp. DMU1]|uniref:hypothetical protein n=1 Tax=Rhodococcus sp. DMU1 TaxID=2722825 RepID=UPI00143EC10B|nr:hypothetical protein [Rhodococcus sp. DMU1]QIX52412.1 hypothetical protein HFP48_24740 [Rhodococcus sp. DMU1]
MASIFRYVLFVVGGFTAGLVLAAPSVDTYPLADGLLPGPVFTSDVAAAAAGGLAALAAAATVRRRVLAAALVGAMAMAVVALPGGWRFDVYVATIGAGLLLGALVVLGAGKLHAALPGAVVAGLLTAEPLAQFRELDSAPQRYASYLAASVQPVNAVWLSLAIVTAVAAGVVALTAGNDEAPVAAPRVRGREVAVGIGVPILGVGLYWSFHHALFSLHDLGEGRWLWGLVAVPVLIAAALWLRRRTGAVLLAATAVVVAAGGTVSWSPAVWPALLIAPALVAVGAWLGRRRPMPVVGVGLLALAAAAGIFDRPPWDNANFVATILVVPFAAAYTIVASLPSTAPVTATSLALPSVLALPLVAQFGWTAYTPLTDDAAGWSPGAWTWTSVGASTAAILACGAAMVWLRHRGTSEDIGT